MESDKTLLILYCCQKLNENPHLESQIKEEVEVSYKTWCVQFLVINRWADPTYPIDEMKPYKNPIKLARKMKQKPSHMHEHIQNIN